MGFRGGEWVQVASAKHHRGLGESHLGQSIPPQDSELKSDCPGGSFAVDNGGGPLRCPPSGIGCNIAEATDNGAVDLSTAGSTGEPGGVRRTRSDRRMLRQHAGGGVTCLERCSGRRYRLHRVLISTRR